MAFPTTLDTLKDTWSGSEAPYGHANHHNNLAVLVYAIQAKLGINGSAVTSSIDYLLKNTSSQNPGHKHTWSDIATKPTTLGGFGITDGVSITAPTFKDITDPTKIAMLIMSEIPTASTKNYKFPNTNNEFLVTSTTERTGASTDVLRGDGTWGGVGDNFIVAPNYAYTKGDPIAWNGTNWVKALANNISTCRVFGLAGASGASGSNVILIQRGILSGLSGLSLGVTYYISDTGTLSATPGTYRIPVGQAISATQIDVTWTGPVKGLVIDQTNGTSGAYPCNGTIAFILSGSTGGATGDNSTSYVEWSADGSTNWIQVYAYGVGQYNNSYNLAFSADVPRGFIRGRSTFLYTSSNTKILL